ncbi:hypothetical protein RB653_000562 [Dictyostelium firmibasis]|uniref:Uncharacterized protein n=1 Tax=Dictyostelium firmibasis TaxID=79012 RepID=A0AAN7U2H7_9MYCE
MNSAEIMIKNGEINLLKSKVNNGDYLLFKETKIKETKPLIQYEFSIFKDRKEFDYEFYKNLFKNYPNYFLFSKNTTAEYYILPNDNEIALNVLINEFNYQPTPNYFIDSIRNSKFKITNYLNENHKSTTTDLVKFFNNGDGKASKIISTDLNAISIVPNLINHRNLFTISLSTLFTTCCKIVDFSNQLNDFINFMNDLSNNTNQNHNRQDLNFDVISLLKYFKYLTSLEKPFKLLSKEELNEMKFTNEELKQFVGSFSKDDERVEELIKMILPFSGRYGYSENFTSYQYKYSKITLKPEQINVDVDPLEFGLFIDSRNQLKENQQLFKFIKYDKEKQITFLNLIIETFNKKPINSTQSIADDELSKKTNTKEISSRKALSPRTFFNLMVDFDNLEYIKIIHQGLFLDNKNKIPFDFIDYVKSNQIFDYILQFINVSYIKATTPLHNIIKRLVKTGRIELLENFKFNHRELYNECFKYLTFTSNEEETFNEEFIDSTFIGLSGSLSKINYYGHRTTINGFKYLYSNYEEFESCFFNNLKEWEITNISGINDLKYLINETPLVKINFKNWEYIKVNENDNLLEFVMKHNQMVEESNNSELKKFVVTEKHKKNFSYTNKSIQEVLPIGTPIDSVLLSFLLDKALNDLNQLEYIMSNFFKDKSQNIQYQYYLGFLFTNVICSGKLHIFKYLKQNYPWVFSIDKNECTDESSSKIEPTLLSSNLELSQLFSNIVFHGNIDMFLFFTHELLLPFNQKYIQTFDQNSNNNVALLKFIKKNQIMF